LPLSFQHVHLLSITSFSFYFQGVQNTKADITSEHPPVIFPQRINDFALTEWHQLRDVGKCCSSWRIAKQVRIRADHTSAGLTAKHHNQFSCMNALFVPLQMTDSLRKNSGLTEPEIQNLLKSSSVADSYVKKLNNKITSALKVSTLMLVGM